MAGTECVEVAAMAPGVVVRDSKDPTGPRLEMEREVFIALLTGIRAL